MFLAPQRIPFTLTLERNFPVFQREIAKLQKSDFVDWPERQAYGGQWLVFPLFLETFPQTLVVDFERNISRCPETVNILKSIPNIVGAGLSRIESGCHIYPHVDGKQDRVVRCHVGIVTPPGALIRVGSEIRGWNQGECLIFDGYLEHEIENQSTESRTILIVDVRLDRDLYNELGLLDRPYRGANAMFH